MKQRRRKIAPSKSDDSGSEDEDEDVKFADLLPKEKHIDIKDLQDPKKVDKLIQRFSAMWDMNNSTLEEVAPVLTLFSEPTEAGISVDLMMSITKLRRGGF